MHTGDKTRTISDTKKLLEHFRRSTCYQKRNGTHNSHKATYKVIKEAGTKDEEQIDSGALGQLAYVAGKTDPLSLDDAQQVNHYMRMMDQSGYTPDDINREYAGSHDYDIDSSFLKNRANAAGGMALGSLILDKGLISPLGYLGSVAKTRYGLDRAAKLSKGFSAWSAARAAGGATSDFLFKDVLGRLSNTGSSLFTSGAGNTNKLIKFMPKMLTGGGALKALNLGTKGLSKAFGYAGPAIQGFEYLLSGPGSFGKRINPFTSAPLAMQFGRNTNNLAAISALQDQDNSKWRGAKEVGSAALNLPMNLFGTGSAVVDTLTGATANKREGLATGFSSLLDKSNRLTKEWNTISKQLNEARAARSNTVK